MNGLKLYRYEGKKNFNAWRVLKNKLGILCVVVFIAAGIFRIRVNAAISNDMRAFEALKTDVKVNAASAIIIDRSTGKILFDKNSSERFQPASTVKVMTALVALENLSLDDKIKATNSVLHVEPTYAGIKPDATYALKDLLSCILVKSGNDAAVAIAVGVAGTEKEFVEMMNAKARALGMTNTNFTSASGLPAKPRSTQYSTAGDLAILMYYASRKPFIVQELSKKKKTVKGNNGINMYLKTHNKSLYADYGGSWGKTGYTRVARRTFTGMDPSNDPKIVIALMKSNKLWADIKTLITKGLVLQENQPKGFWEKLKEKHCQTQP